MHQDILQHFEEAIAFIEQALASNGIILVHCFAGISRSASCVIAYKMKKYKMTSNEAHMAVSEKRCVCPNEAFSGQLYQYEQ